MVWVFIVASFTVPLIVGFLAARHDKGWVVMALAGAFLLVILWAVSKASQAHGMDGLAWGMVAYLGGGPAMIGVLGGGAVGLILRKRAERRGADS